MMKKWNLEKIYLDCAVQDAPVFQTLLNQLQGIPVERVTDPEKFLEKIRLWPVASGKKNLWLTCFKGPLVKPCPGTGKHYLCCRYWVMNAQTQCPLDCHYCVLQGYLDPNIITLYSNVQDVFKEIDALIESYPGRIFRIGTGELTDSLALDVWSDWNRGLIEGAVSRKFLLELKTKTDFVGHLPEILNRRRNVIISWSLNPQNVISALEPGSAFLEERLEAAAIAANKGYRIGFHFDPILETGDQEKKYMAVIDRLTEEISEEDVAWISLGSLRFPPFLKRILRQRFAKSPMTGGEFVRGLDGKMRYFRLLRVRMYGNIYRKIRDKWKDVFVYLCMENQAVWKNVMGMAPDNNADLDRLFHESLGRRFPDLRLELPNKKDYRED